MSKFDKITTSVVRILGYTAGTWFAVCLSLIAFGLATGGAIWSIRWMLTLMGVGV